VTLCESFLGIEPHFLLWRSIFWLRPNVALARKPELGRAVISVRPEAQYLEFSMAVSVQEWRTKWFYIKDRKASPEVEYGLAPFDASKEVKKLASWDSLPSDAEIEQITPLLSPIQALKGGKGGALSGIQLMAFFVQRRVQPLQHRLTKLWSYSGLVDPSRISGYLMKKEEVNKRVRSLTKLTKDHAVTELAANYFDSVHPLPEVCIYLFRILVVEFHWFPTAFIGYFSDLSICRTINSSLHCLLFPKKDLLRLIWPPLYLKPPRLKRIRMEMKPKNQKKIPAQRHLLLLRFPKTLV
jgi:hypothetical protein